MSEQKDNGGSAFPVPPDSYGVQGNICQPYDFGMTLRHWFATFAPEPTEEEYKRMLDPFNNINKQLTRKQVRAQFKFQHADAMIEEGKQL